MLKNYFGSSPEVKILDFFIGYNASWNITEIQDKAHIARATLKVAIPKLLRNKLIVVDRKIGNSCLYKLNLKNVVVVKLIKLSRMM